MRSVSGARNRTRLAVSGVLSLLLATWLAFDWFNLKERSDALSPILLPGSRTLGSIWVEQRSWLLPAAAVLSILLVLLGLLTLLRQVPRRPKALPLRLVDGQGRLVASAQSAVMEKALAGRVAAIPGVLGSTVHLSGAANDLCVQCELTIAESAQVSWVIDAARKRLAGDLAQALSSAPRRVDVLVRLRPAPEGAGQKDGAVVTAGAPQLA